MGPLVMSQPNDASISPDPSERGNAPSLGEILLSQHRQAKRMASAMGAHGGGKSSSLVHLKRLLDAPPTKTKESIAGSRPDDNTQGGERVSSPHGSVDLAFITAIADPEHTKLLEVLNVQNAQKVFAHGFILLIGDAQFGSHKLRVACACSASMGMVAAAVCTTKVLYELSPKLVIMTGVCAGVESQVSKGDVVVGRFVFDYGCGKIEKGKLHPDYEPVQCGDIVSSVLQDSIAECEKSLCDEWNRFTGSKPSQSPRVHVGSMASGAAVVADQHVINGIVDHKRKLHGLDMEAYGVARAVASATQRPTTWLIAKAVQDFADSQKDDSIRGYCALISAAYAKTLVEKQYMNIIRVL